MINHTGLELNKKRDKSCMFYFVRFFYKARWFAPIYLKYGFIWKCCSPYKPLNLFSFQIFWRLNFLLTLRIRIHSDSTNYFFICSTFYLYSSVSSILYLSSSVYLVASVFDVTGYLSFAVSIHYLQFIYIYLNYLLSI